MDQPNTPAGLDAFLSAPAAQPQAPSEPAGLNSFIEEDLKEEKYGTPGQQAIAGLEGLAKGVAGPLATYAERMAGVKPEDIRGREEVNPVTHGVAEAAGLGAGFLTGTGEAGLAMKAGELAEVAVGLGKVSEAANLARLAKAAKDAPEAAQLALQAAEAAKGVSFGAKVGSAAVKQAAEMAILESGDLVSNRLVNDPQTASESALANIGLMAALGGAGGAFGAGVVSPLWKATAGPKIEGALKALTSHMGGAEGQLARKTAQELEAVTGVMVPQELKPVINEVPGAMSTHSYLNQNDTSIAGRAYQRKVNEYESQLAAKSLESLGKAPNSIEALPELDKYAMGRAQGEALKRDLEQMARPTLNGYNTFNEEAKNSIISGERKRMIADQIANTSIEKGWHKAQDEGSAKLAQDIISKLEKQETVQDLKKFITNLRENHPFGKETYGAARDMGRILHSNLEDIVAENIMRAGGSSQQAAAKVNAYNQLRKNYASLMNHIDNLNEHLHVGRYDGPESFMKALGEHSTQHGERVINQLSGKNNANVLELLKSSPEALNLVKSYHVDNLLSEAVQKAPAGKKINVNHLVNTIGNPNKMSPQVRSLIMSPEQQKVMQGVQSALEAMKDPTHNFSNTARTVAKQSYGAISPISLIAALMGHGEAGLLSFMGSLGMSEARPAVKLALLKFLGSEAPVKAEGFKTMVSMIDSAYKSEKTLNKAVKGLFVPGMSVLKDSEMPSAKEIAKLNKLVSEHKDNPDKLLQQQTGNLAHYAPVHDVATAKATQTALNYLQSIKPQPAQSGPLDKPLPVDPGATARYNRALSIAQNPMVVLKHVKDGTLQRSDVQDLNALYPGYSKMVAEAVTNELVTHQSKEEPVPYKTRMGLSLFLGQPMDSSMKPASIIAAQPAPKGPPQQEQAQGKTKRGTTSLGKHNSMYNTPQQAAETDKSSRD